MTHDEQNDELRPEERAEAELLERLLSGAPAGDADAAHARDVEAFLARCRTELSDEALVPPALEERVRASVLARTTREDLRWRGDWRLIRGFVRSRLASSVALRLAAASLLVHLIALPVLAWYGFHVNEPVIRIDWQRNQPEVFEEGTEPESVVEDLDIDELPELREDDEVEGTMRWARMQLSLGPRSGAAAPDAPLVERLLAARSLAMHGEAWELPGLEPAAAGPLAVALYAEFLLDEMARTGAEPAGLAAALDALCAPGRPALALEAMVLARARAYGVRTGPLEACVARAQREFAGDADVSRLLVTDGFRAAGPLDPTWFEALAAELDRAGQDGPIARAWLAWNEAR